MTGAGAGLVVRPLLGPGRPVEGRGKAGVSVRQEGVHQADDAVLVLEGGAGCSSQGAGKLG